MAHATDLNFTNDDLQTIESEGFDNCNEIEFDLREHTMDKHIRKNIPRGVVYANQAKRLSDLEGEILNHVREKSLETISDDQQKVLINDMYNQDNYEYVEVFTETPILVNGVIGDKIESALINVSLEDHVSGISGVLDSWINADGTVLSYEYNFNEKDERFYSLVKLDGVYIQGFAQSALTEFVFRALQDRNRASYQSIIKNCLSRFTKRGPQVASTIPAQQETQQSSEMESVA